MKRFLIILVAMTLVDWALGALHVARLIPLATFLIFNFPFGIPFVWIESLWAGNRYQIGNDIIGENWAMLAWLFAVIAQTFLYWLIFRVWRKRRNIPSGF